MYLENNDKWQNIIKEFKLKCPNFSRETHWQYKLWVTDNHAANISSAFFGYIVIKLISGFNVEQFGIILTFMKIWLSSAIGLYLYIEWFNNRKKFSLKEAFLGKGSLLNAFSFTENKELIRNQIITFSNFTHEEKLTYLNFDRFKMKLIAKTEDTQYLYIEYSPT